MSEASSVLSQQAAPQKKLRDSSIELLRIITMIVIVAHHYVVNSGLLDVIAENGIMKGSSLFLLLLGWGGKTGINCAEFPSGIPCNRIYRLLSKGTYKGCSSGNSS